MSWHEVQRALDAALVRQSSLNEHADAVLESIRYVLAELVRAKAQGTALEGDPMDTVMSVVDQLLEWDLDYQAKVSELAVLRSLISALGTEVPQ